MFRRKRTRAPTDFGAEIEAHIELETARLREEGLSEAQARAAAHRAFGNRLRAEERFYESGRWLAWDHFVQDARYALRMMRKSPGFAAVAVLTVALGIGATTAIFSVVDATLLHPLPYPRPEQLVRIQADLPGVGTKDVGMSYPEIQDLARSGIFRYVSPTWYDDNNLTGSSAPARVSLLIVAPTYFALLGVKPEIGHTFDPGNHAPGFTGEVVISDGMWKRSFASDPRVLGTGVRIDTDLYRVIGVMPPGFHAPGKTTRERNIEVWAATTFYGPPLLDHPPRNGRNLPTAIARLAPGLTIAAAQSRLDALVASLQKEFPEDYPARSAWTLRLAPLKEGVVGNVRQPLLLLLGAVGLVLLIGCVNVANLLLARSSARGREMAIRQSLGAARARLMRQLLTESLCLSVLGGVAGLGILFCARGFLTRLIPESLPRLNDIAVSRGVLLFAVAASVAAGALFGLAPALQAGRLKLISNLKREGRGSTGSREQARTRRALIVAEFALSLVLLAAASLLLRSFRDLVNVRLGFDPDRVMTVRTRFPYPNDVKIDAYATIAQESRFTRELIRRTRRLPGVEEAALGDVAAVPLAHDRDNQTPPVSLILEGRAPAGANDFPLVDSAFVTPEYFRLLRVTLRRGRLLTDFDTEETPPVAVINESMAKTYWPGADPIGRHLKLDKRSESWATVIGVVADARAEAMENAAIPLIYTSMYQKVEHRVPHHLAIFLRGNLDPAAITAQVRREVQAIDPGLPVFGEQRLGETVAAALAARRFAMEMVGLFALTALLLAAIGIYGVISFVVSERAHEIGVRLALGAGNRDIRRMVLRQGLGLALAGAAVGLPCALVASHLMAGLLFGVRPTDVPTFAAVAAVLIGVALLASAVPARRATRIDPMRLLRDA